MSQRPLTESRFRRLMVQAVAVHITILAGVALVSFFLVNNVLSANRRLERTYRVTIPDEAVGKQAFASVNALAGYVAEHRPA